MKNEKNKNKIKKNIRRRQARVYFILIFAKPVHNPPNGSAVKKAER